MTQTQKTVARGAGAGAAKSAIGAFGLAVLVELGALPQDIGPNTLILLTWLAGQVLYTALSPRQWSALVGK